MLCETAGVPGALGVAGQGPPGDDDVAVDNDEDLLAGTRPPEADILGTIPAPRMLVVLAVMYAVVSAASIAGVVGAALAGVPVAYVVCGMLAVAMGSCAAMMLRLALVSAVITATAVATPGTFRGWTIVPLRAVAGVGLRYRSTGNARSSSWRLFVWCESGPPIGIKATPPSYSAPPGKHKFVHRLTGYVPPLDWGYIAASGAGQGAVAIDAAVTAAQGSGGLLATMRREQDQDTYDGVHTAYWSPAGPFGALIEPRKQMSRPR